FSRVRERGRQEEKRRERPDGLESLQREAEGGRDVRSRIDDRRLGRTAARRALESLRHSPPACRRDEDAEHPAETHRNGALGTGLVEGGRRMGRRGPQEPAGTGRRRGGGRAMKKPLALAAGFLTAGCVAFAQSAAPPAPLPLDLAFSKKTLRTWSDRPSMSK